MFNPIDIHPGRLTWNIKMEVWKIIFLSKWVICRFHVNLPGCNRNKWPKVILVTAVISPLQMELWAHYYNWFLSPTLSMNLFFPLERFPILETKGGMSL